MLPLSPTTPADELKRLARSPDPAVRQAVAQHPNAPAEFAPDVALDQALILLRLAEPHLLQGWPAVAAERLVHSDQAPEWVLEAALLTRLAQRPEWFLRAAAARAPELGSAWHATLITACACRSRPGRPHCRGARLTLQQDAHALVRQRAGGGT